MCSETNVRSECRLLPIIRCRGVPLCARGWSADSVPRFYAARQPGPVRARGYPRKPRAKCVAKPWSTTVRRVSNLTLAPRVGLKGRGRETVVEGCGRRRTAGLFVRCGVSLAVSMWNGRRALRGRVRACAFCGKCRRWRWHSMIDDDGGGLRRTERVCVCVCANEYVHTSHQRLPTRARTYVRARPCVRVCACVRSRARTGMCMSARARGHDDFGKHGGLCRPMAARLLAGRATAIRDDEERGRETGRRERMTGRDDGSGGERTGFATSNNECLLPPAKPSFSLLQPADEAPRASPSNPPFTIARRIARCAKRCKDGEGSYNRYK